MADDLEAEFLARERAELGDIAAELGNGTGSDIGSTEDLKRASELVFEPEGTIAMEKDVVECPEENTPDTSVPPTNNLPETVSPIIIANSPSPVPEQLKNDSQILESWRVNFEACIKARDEKEEKQKTELMTAATKELETWYSHYRQQQAVKSSDNRSEAPKDPSGKAYTEYSGPKPSVNDAVVWESVCGMCDLQGKSSRSTQDLSRMRSLLLSLKKPLSETNSVA